MMSSTFLPALPSCVATHAVRRMPNSLRTLTLISAAWLTGCASFSPDGGFDAVQTATRSHIQQDVVWTRDDASREQAQARIDTLLAHPLDADNAVQIALLNNPGLQATFYRLGIAEADWVQAQTLPNPGMTVGRLTRGDEVEWNAALHLFLLQILTIPMRADIEQRLFEKTRTEITLEVLRLAAETRKAYFIAVAADETARYMRQAMDAAEAGAELGRRMAQAGNWSKLKQAREQAFYDDTVLTLARAEQARVQSHERLIRLLGLENGTRLSLPDHLPDLPASLPALPDIEQQAMDQRLDLQMQRQAADALAANLGLTRSTRFINVLELGLINSNSNVEPTQRGFELNFELPLFDWGQARVARAESIYMQTVQRTAAMAINARSEVRESYAAYRSQFDIARHYRDEVVPLQKQISEENLLRYNGMLISVFELLADARSQIASVNNAIGAQRDFWLAQSDMQMALIGSPDKTPINPIMSAPAAAGRH
jgi:outer membrane protein TolC